MDTNAIDLVKVVRTIDLYNKLKTIKYRSEYILNDLEGKIAQESDGIVFFIKE